MIVKAGRCYEITSTTAIYDGLCTKAGLLPEGVDLLRLDPENLQILLERRQEKLDGRTLLRSGEENHSDRLPWQVHRNGRPFFIDPILAIKSQRQSENFSFADSWLTKLSPAVQIGVLVVPQLIELEGSIVHITGKFHPSHDPLVELESAVLDQDGWASLVDIAYDFTQSSGELVFSTPT